MKENRGGRYAAGNKARADAGAYKAAHSKTSQPSAPAHTAVQKKAQQAASRARTKRAIKVVLAVFCCLLIVVAAAGIGIYFGVIAPGFEEMNRPSYTLPTGVLDTPAPPVEGEKPSFNILLVGEDRASGSTDTIMLLSADGATGTMHLTSIPRDTGVLVNGRMRKINSTRAYGGTELLIKVVKDLTGCPVHYYAVVDLSVFSTVVDMLDGVEFYVPQDMQYKDPYQDLYIDLKEGLQVLDGDKAEQLVRFRGYPMADIQRTQVQRDFLKAIFEQKFNAKYLDRALSIFSAVSSKVETNLSLDDLNTLLDLVSFFTGGQFETHAIAWTAPDENYIIPKYAETDEMFRQFFLGEGAPAEPVYRISAERYLETKPTPTPTPTPVPEVTLDPTPEVTPEVTPDTTPEPTPESTPDGEPTVTPAPENTETPTPDPEYPTEPED